MVPLLHATFTHALLGLGLPAIEPRNEDEDREKDLGGVVEDQLGCGIH